MIGTRAGMIAHESITTGRNKNRLTGTNNSVNELSTKGKGVKVLIATNRYADRPTEFCWTMTNSNRPTTISSTGLKIKMAGRNANQANAAGSAGKALTKTGAVTSDEPKNPAMILFI